jgi:hypothetical protein
MVERSSARTCSAAAQAVMRRAGSGAEDGQPIRSRAVPAHPSNRLRDRGRPDEHDQDQSEGDEPRRAVAARTGRRTCCGGTARDGGDLVIAAGTTEDLIPHAIGVGPRR